MPVILSRYRPLAPGGREEQRLTAEGCLIKNGQLVVGLPRRRNSDGPCQKGSVSKSSLHVLANDFPKSQAFRWLVQKKIKIGPLSSPLITASFLSPRRFVKASENGSAPTAASPAGTVPFFLFQGTACHGKGTSGLTSHVYLRSMIRHRSIKSGQ